MKGSPEYMRAFKPWNRLEEKSYEWESWSALYQPDGGSVNMEASYKAFYDYVYSKKKLTTILDETNITKF